MHANIQAAITLCGTGFRTYSPEYYAEIDRLLADVEQTDAVTRARRLCAAGPTLSSPRFAYPHIESALSE